LYVVCFEGFPAEYTTCWDPDQASGATVTFPEGVSFSWPGCIGISETAFALFGSRCGFYADKFFWTGLFAYSTRTGELYQNCLMLRSNENSEDTIANLFGADCGVAPKWFSGVPTTVCLERGGKGAWLRLEVLERVQYARTYLTLPWRF
jgi:hypothetical protein